MAKQIFTTTILKFGSKGDKTGWTYIQIPQDICQQLKPGNKQAFKVKGKLDKFNIKRQSIMPMGDGSFMMPLNADLRKAIGKQHGALLTVELLEDTAEFVFNSDFIECLKDDPLAKTFFESLTGSHQRYFSKWIDSAKTESTKVKRITMAVDALAKHWGYPEMIRASQGKPLK